MSAGFEWGGYASQPLSGVSEALDAAGIDCVIRPHGADEDDPGIQPRWWESPAASSPLSRWENEGGAVQSGPVR